MKQRKKINFSHLHPLLISLLLFPLGNDSLKAQILAGDSWASVKQYKKGTILLTYIKTPGLAYKNTDGNLEGLCFDIVKEFSNYLNTTYGISLRIRVLPETKDFKQFLENIRTARGGVFGLGNITITQEREQTFDFSPSFLNNLTFILTHSSIPELSSLRLIGQQFKGMKAVTVKGSTNEKVILQIKQKYFPNLPIVYVPSSGTALTKVVSDNRSFTSLDFNYYAEALKYNLSVRRHPPGDLYSEKFGFIMPNNSDWQGVWREFLVENNFKRSSTYRKILIKHLGLSAVKALERFGE
ncbi:MAG: transporter substrate-binding domain-containing protein [Bacteroidota bacterium]